MKTFSKPKSREMTDEQLYREKSRIQEERHGKRRKKDEEWLRKIRVETDSRQCQTWLRKNIKEETG